MPSLTRYQKGEMRTIHRSQISWLPDNPQGMLDDEKARLSKSIKTHGLLDRIVWNERTGNCAGGNHRLRELDKLEGHQDYNLEVLAINVDERNEREIALQLNNRHAQGDLKPEVLSKWIKEDKIDLERAGYTPSDAWRMFGKPAEDILGAKPELLAKLGEAQRLVEQAQQRQTERVDGRDDVNFWCRLIFKGQEQRDGLLNFLRVLYGLRPEVAMNLNIDGRLIMDLIDGQRTVVPVDGVPVPCVAQDRSATFTFSSPEARKRVLERIGLSDGRLFDGAILEGEIDAESTPS